jgi:CRISPR-associated protein Cas8b1/Cst1 subtype I-B
MKREILITIYNDSCTFYFYFYFFTVKFKSIRQYFFVNMTVEAIKQEIHDEFFKLLKNKIPENILINLQTELKKEEQIKENTFVKIIKDSQE